MQIPYAQKTKSENFSFCLREKIETSTLHQNRRQVSIPLCAVEGLAVSYGVAAPSNGLIVQGNVGVGTTSPRHAPFSRFERTSRQCRALRKFDRLLLHQPHNYL